MRLSEEWGIIQLSKTRSKADVFITHCGMNSVSESLYMATPMVLYAQTNEQEAVARRVREIGAGIDLKEDSVAGIRNAVKGILDTASYRNAAKGDTQDTGMAQGFRVMVDYIEKTRLSAIRTVCREPFLLQLSCIDMFSRTPIRPKRPKTR